MKIKVADLTGAALDYAVAKAEDLNVNQDPLGVKEVGDLDQRWWAQRSKNGWQRIGGGYSPSTLWEQAGKIIEQASITLIRCDDDYEIDSKGFITNRHIPVWAAERGGYHSTYTSYEGEYYNPKYEIPQADCVYGPTPLVAAMRCFVASKLGDEIEIPEELCPVEK